MTTKPIHLTDNAIARFWKRVDTSAGSDGCWPWLGAKKTNGYGFFKDDDGRRLMAHRVSAKIKCSDFIDDLCTLHRCDNPSCCNPSHLFAGTIGQNNSDRSSKGRNAKLTKENHPTRLHPECICRGEEIGASKLKSHQVIEIRSSHESNRVLAQRYGVSEGNIYCVRSRRTWKHIL